MKSTQLATETTQRKRGKARDGSAHFRKRTETRTRADGTVKTRFYWEAQYYLPSGSRKSLYGKSLSDVKAKHKAALADLEAGVDLEAKTGTVAAFLGSWLTDVVSIRNRPRTVEGYRGYVTRYMVPEIGAIKLRNLKQADVDKMLRQMSDAEKSPRTVQQCRAILRAALNHAVRSGLIARNPAQYATVPRSQSIERPYLTADQANNLLSTAREHDPELHPLVTLGLFTGMRFGELAGLRWQDVDLETRTLRVRQVCFWVGGEPGFGEPKTRKSARTLSLPTPAITVLQEQHDRQAFQRKTAGNRWRQFDLVFATVLGTPIDPSNCYGRLRKLLTLAGLPKMGFHALRHSTASLLLAAGVPMRAISEQLGHSQMSLTADLYSHVAPAMLESNAEALERALAW